MLTFKEGVRIKVTAPAMAYLLSALDLLSERPEFVAAMQHTELMITAGCDGQHLPNSRHYRHEALDLRVHSVLLGQREWFRGELERLLNRPFDDRQFTVLLEDDGRANEHLHVQVTMGRTFAPASPTSQTPILAPPEALVEPT